MGYERTYQVPYQMPISTRQADSMGYERTYQIPYQAPTNSRQADSMGYERTYQMPYQTPTTSRQADTMGYGRTEQQFGQMPPPPEYSESAQYNHLDPLDQEMLAEAQEDGQYATGPESNGNEDAELEKNLAWIPRHPVARSRAPLPVCYSCWWGIANLHG